MKSKSFIVVMIVMLLSLSMVLTACSTKETDNKVPKKEEDVSILPVEEEEEVEGEVIEEVVIEEEVIINPEDEVDNPEETVSNIGIEFVDSSIDNPANIGDWVKGSHYSTATKKSHEVAVRITNVERDVTKVQEAIDKYTENDGFYIIEPIQQDDLEYSYIDYEVYIPEDFPSSEYGLVDGRVTITPRNPLGGGFESKGMVYIGLSSTDISEKVEELNPGDTYKGRMLYVMVKGTTDYVFESSYENINTENHFDEFYIKGQ